MAASLSGRITTVFWESDIERFAESRRLNGSIYLFSEKQDPGIYNFGYANHQETIPCSEYTQYPIASLTKQFTAVAILKLLEDPKLLQRPLSYLLPADHKLWSGNPPIWLDDINIHHMLSNSSGIPNYTSLPEFQSAKQNDLSLQDLVGMFGSKNLEFKPGTQYSYSNSGYILLGEIIEKLSSQTTSNYMSQAFFSPLGMKSTSYVSSGVVPDLINEEGLQNLALGYRIIDSHSKQNLEEIPTYTPMHIPRAAGSIISTASDLMLWNQSIHSGDLLEQSLLNLMLTPHHQDLPGPWNRLGCHYGYGIAMNTSQKYGQYYVHHGGINGFQSGLVYIPSLRTSLIMLTNVEYAPSMDEDGHYNLLSFEKFLLHD